MYFLSFCWYLLHPVFLWYLNSFLIRHSLPCDVTNETHFSRHIYTISPLFHAQHTYRTVSASSGPLRSWILTDYSWQKTWWNTVLGRRSHVPVEWLVFMHKWPSWAPDLVAELTGCQAEFGVSRTGVSRALPQTLQSGIRIVWCCMLLF